MTTDNLIQAAEKALASWDEADLRDVRMYVTRNMEELRAALAEAKAQAIDKCKCSFRIRMVGDGCRYCQPQEYIDRLRDQIAEDQQAPKCDSAHCRCGVRGEPLTEESMLDTALCISLQFQHVAPEHIVALLENYGIGTVQQEGK